VALVSPLSHQPAALSVATCIIRSQSSFATGLPPDCYRCRRSFRSRAAGARRCAATASLLHDPSTPGARPSNRPPRSRRPGRGKDRADRTVCV